MMSVENGQGHTDSQDGFVTGLLLKIVVSRKLLPAKRARLAVV